MYWSGLRLSTTRNLHKAQADGDGIVLYLRSGDEGRGARGEGGGGRKMRERLGCEGNGIDVRWTDSREINYRLRQTGGGGLGLEGLAWQAKDQNGMRQ